jgi:hypothetical protein
MSRTLTGITFGTGMFVAGAALTASLQGQATGTAMFVERTASVTAAATPKPSGYCKKADHGKKYYYTTPSGKSKYWLKCVPTTTWKWKKA